LNPLMAGGDPILLCLFLLGDIFILNLCSIQI
jgi:hypothetical protein